MVQKGLKKRGFNFLVMALLIEKRSPPLIKVRKMYFKELKISVIVGNESRVVVSHQIFFIDSYICVFNMDKRSFNFI